MKKIGLLFRIFYIVMNIKNFYIEYSKLVKEAEIIVT